MLYFLDSQYIKWKYRAIQFVEDLEENEYGVSGIVAAILLLMIAMLLAAVFWNRIKGLVNAWTDKITESSSGLGDGLNK